MDDLGERAVALTRELIAIDSVNPSLAPGSTGEQPIAAFAAVRLAAAGFTVHLVQSSDPTRPSVVAVREGSRRGRSVVLNGHLDTVPVDGMPEPFVPRLEGSRLYGRGASDMKGGVAGILAAAEELAGRDAPGTLAVALVADEEDGSIGATAVLETLESIMPLPDVCLIAEPTWLDLAGAHRGYEVVRVRFKGRAAHSSQPEEGVDVMPAIAQLLAAVIEHDRGLQRIPPDPQLQRGSLMTTVVRAGSAPFTLPAAAEVLVERRTLPSERPDEGLVEVEAIVAGLDLPLGSSVEVRSVIHRAPWQCAEAGASAELADQLRAALPFPPAMRGFPYWMESALWEEAGIPTVVCGPAGGGLHAVDEWVDLDQVRAYPAAVVDAVGRFLAG